MSAGYALNDADQEACRHKAKMLTKVVRNQLMSFDGSSISVLEKIAETPPSALKALRRSWDRIETYYYPEYMRETDANADLRKAIIRQRVTGCKNKRAWEIKMAKVLGLGSFETLRDRLDALKKKQPDIRSKSREKGTYRKYRKPAEEYPPVTEFVSDTPKGHEK